MHFQGLLGLADGSSPEQTSLILGLPDLLGGSEAGCEFGAMLSCAGTFLPSASSCALPHRGFGSRIPAGHLTGPGQLPMTQVPFLEVPLALPGSSWGGWCCCAGDGQSSPGLETGAAQSPGDPLGSPLPQECPGEQFSLRSWPAPGNLLQPPGGMGAVPRGRGRCGEGTNPVSTLLWDMHVLWVAAVMGKHSGEPSSSSSSSCCPSLGLLGQCQLLQQDRSHLLPAPILFGASRSTDTSG